MRWSKRRKHRRPYGWTRRSTRGGTGGLVLLLAVAPLLLTATNATGQEDADDVERVRLPRPTGTHGVGTVRMALTDTTRGEQATADPDDHRELVVQLWYPTGGPPRPSSEAYMDTATARTWVERHEFPEGFARRVTNYAHPGADVLGGRHPTLIFSHGLSWPVLMYQSYLEDLASHGYVVAAVNHTYGSDMVVFPDGRRVGYAFFPPDLDAGSARDSVLAARVGIWAEDLRFVADELERLDRSDHPLGGAIDLERLGVFGHSYGGSASALVLKSDGRFDAALAMEGSVRDSAARPLALPRPFMHVVGGFNRDEMGGLQYRAGEAPYYEVVVEGMWHAMFADLILLYAELAADPAWHARHAHEMSPRRGLTVTRDLTRAFFDRWLLEEDSALLHPWWPPDPSSRLTSPYPEVELRIDYGSPNP